MRDFLLEKFEPEDKQDIWIEQIAQQLGEKIKKFVGGGSFGFAYETKSGKILKITADPIEIRLAYKLSKNRNWFKYIINYYNVGKTNRKLKNDGVMRNAYYLLMDKVTPIDNTGVGVAVDKIYTKLIQYKENYYENIMDYGYVMREIKQLKENPYYNAMDVKEIARTAREIYPYIKNIVKELKLHQIVATDFHSGNIGWNKDKTALVLYDLGGYVDNSTGIRIKGKLKTMNIQNKRPERFIKKFENFKNDNTI